MHTYRCYLLDARGHIALAAQVIECLDDGEAASRATKILEKRADCSGIEVWEFGRRVQLIAAEAEMYGSG